MMSGNNQKSGITRVNSLIAEISTNSKNSCGPIIINELKRELIIFREKISIPRIHVSRIDYEESADVVSQLCRIIPEYLIGHTLLAEQKPAADTHSLQFVKLFSGKVFEYIHMLRIDLKYGPGIGVGRGGGTTDYFQAFDAEGLIVSSTCIPVTDVKREDGLIVDFDPIRVAMNENVEGGERRQVHTFFDDFDPSQINSDTWNIIGGGIFPFSANIFPFVSYSHFTACLNLPDSKPAILEKALSLFEPIFLLILSRMAEYPADKACELYSDFLKIDNGNVALADAFIREASAFFSRYALYQDDEFMLKRWRRLDVVTT